MLLNNGAADPLVRVIEDAHVIYVFKILLFQFCSWAKR